jgi:hypothetical protein
MGRLGADDGGHAFCGHAEQVQVDLLALVRFADRSLGSG